MPISTVNLEEPGWRLHQRFWKYRLQTSVERFTGAQLRSSSLYTNLRALAPLFVLAVVWLLVSGWRTDPDFDRLLSLSITVRHLLLACGIIGVWNLWLALSFYDRVSAGKDLLDECSRLVSASFACSSLLLIGNLTRHRLLQGISLAVLTTFGMLLASSTLLLCFLLCAVLSRRLLRVRATLIVGSGRRAGLLRAQLAQRYSPFQVYGCVDNEYVGTDLHHDLYLGKLDELETILKTHPIESVLIGLPIKSKYDEIQQVIRICESVGVASQYMQDLFETTHARVEVHSQSRHHFTTWSTSRADPKKALKRALDIVGASVVLLVASPLMIAAALAVRFSSPGPVFFIQERYGHHRKRFPMFKFRSMVVDAEAKQHLLETRNEAQGPVFKLSSDPRVTRVGNLLRRTSIDELPQLFNVLRGEMSLVGPRPLPLRDVSRFEELWLLRRFSVQPGLTCIWQVNGRSNTSFEDWIRQDLSYIDQWSLALDLKILLKTVPAVLRGSGAR